MNVLKITLFSGISGCLKQIRACITRMCTHACIFVSVFVCSKALSIINYHSEGERGQRDGGCNTTQIHCQDRVQELAELTA